MQPVVCTYLYRDFDEERGWIVTVLERGDVLYLSVAHRQGSPARATMSDTPQAGVIVGITLTNVWLLDHYGRLAVTLPIGHAGPDDLAQVLKLAA